MGAYFIFVELEGTSHGSHHAMAAVSAKNGLAAFASGNHGAAHRGLVCRSFEMSGRTVSIKFDVSDGRFIATADASDFVGLSDVEIENSIQELIDETGRNNVSFMADNMAAAIAAVKEAVAELEAAYAEELAEIESED